MGCIPFEAAAAIGLLQNPVCGFVYMCACECSYHLNLFAVPQRNAGHLWSIIPVKTKRRSRKSLSTLCSWCACNPAHTHADAHTKDADRVKSGLSLAYLPPSDLKLSVSDEEKKAEGLNRDHSASQRLPDFRKASSLNPQQADYGEKHWWERESVGEVLQEKEKR